MRTALLVLLSVAVLFACGVDGDATPGGPPAAGATTPSEPSGGAAGPERPDGEGGGDDQGGADGGGGGGQGGGAGGGGGDDEGSGEGDGEGGAGGGVPGPPVGEPEPEPAPTTPPEAADLASFLADCERGIREWRPAQVDYPARLTIEKDGTESYVVEVDATETPLDPGDVIPGPEPTSEAVFVRCEVAARLTPLGSALTVDNDDWVVRSFTPTGVIRWTWVVSAVEADDQDLELELQPAVRSEDGTILVGQSSTEISSFLTRVDVETDAVQQVGEWWESRWTIIAMVAAGIGAAVLALLRFGAQLAGQSRRTRAALRGVAGDDGPARPAAGGSSSPHVLRRPRRTGRLSTMSATEPFVIVGGGLAGAKAAETVRDEGYDGPLVVVAAEPESPYERPPLSKGYLLGTTEREKARVHDAGWYAAHHVDLRTGVRATGLDPGGHRVTLDTGEELTYSKLLLATGSSARRLPLPGADLDGVRYLRTLADADRLLADLSGGGRNVVVVGGGWIGLEVTAAARHHGNPVTIVEPQPTPLYAVLGAEMGETFGRLHRGHGVDLRTGTGVREFRGTGTVASVVTDGGVQLPADVVVVGVGAVPNTELAVAAGLHVDNGVVTDAALRTSAADVFAAGDVAAAFHPLYDRNVRVEHWANALNQGPAAARSMLGQDVNYERVPYFFTDQYDLGMEYSGLGGPGDRVVCRGNPDDGEFIAFWTADGRVTAGMNVNVWDVAEPIQQLIRSGRQMPAERLTDPEIPLGELGG